MKYPSWFDGHIKEFINKNEILLKGFNDNCKLKIFYFGDLFKVIDEDQLYIVNTKDKPCLIKAYDEINDKYFTIFDNGKHGYNNMFCDEYSEDALKDRDLQDLLIEATDIIVQFGYSIDYDDEREYFVDESLSTDGIDRSKLINGEIMTYDQVKRDGIDYIAIFYIDNKGNKVEFASYELA